MDHFFFSSYFSVVSSKKKKKRKKNPIARQTRLMQPESFLVLGICSSGEMVQNKTGALLIVLRTVLLLTSGFETARFVPRLKTLTHTQGRRSAERKGQLLTEPRCRKGQIPCAI